MEHLLILNFESGDEIHFTILDIKHLDKIESLLTPIANRVGFSHVNELVNYIIDNTIINKMFQTYVTEVNLIGYNIVKVIHIPELGS